MAFAADDYRGRSGWPAVGVEERGQAALVAVAELGGQHCPGPGCGTVSLVAGQLRDVRQQRVDCQVLAATLFAHDLATLGVDVLAGLGDDGVVGRALGVPGQRRSGLAVAGSAWLVERAGKRGDDFEQQRVDAVLLVGGAAGVELSDGAAVLGVGGELAYPGGDCGGW